MADTFAYRFWKTMAQYRDAVALLLGLEAVLLVLSLIALWLGPDETGTRTVLVANFAFVGAGFVGASYVLYRCREYRGAD